jgi:excisionase family DNA binding protein
MKQPTPKLVTVNEACEQLGLSRDKLYELMADGHIAYVSLPPHSKQAGRRIEQSQIDAFVERNRSTAQ